MGGCNDVLVAALDRLRGLSRRVDKFIGDDRLVANRELISLRQRVERLEGEVAELRSLVKSRDR